MSSIKDRIQASNDRFQRFQKKYPNLFRTYPRSGCDIRPGWESLIDNLCAVLEDHIKRLPDELREHVFVAQIKEKFGTLRFYMAQETPYISGAIAVAESLSEDICETCGERGRLRDGGWILTLCNKHHEENVARKKAEHEAYMKKQKEREEKK